MTRSLPILLLLAACASPDTLPERSPPPDTAGEDTGALEDAWPTGGTAGCDHGAGALGGGALAACMIGLAWGARRRVGGRRAAGAAGVVCLAFAPSARAQQQPTLDVQRFEPSGMVTGFAQTWSARQLPRHRVSFEAMASYGWRVFQRSTLVQGRFLRAEQAIENLTAVHMKLAVAPTDWMQVSLSAPVVQFVTTGPGLETFGGEQTNTVGYGDLQGEIGVIAIPEERGAGLGFTAFVSGPTGSRALLLTDGVPTVGARMAISGVAGPTHLAGHIGYRFKPGSSDVNGKVSVDDGLLYGVGVGFLLYEDIVRLNVEAVGETTVGPGYRRITDVPITGRLHTAAELNGNLRIATRLGFDFLIGGGAGLTPAPGSPAARFEVGFGYVPEAPPDADRDGIVNWEDDCRKDPEDFDNFRDDDGCPEADNDEDGLPDDEDACPDDPEDVDGFEDDDGCPDWDNDRDRVADTVDVCPDVPEDLDRFQDKDGCPDADNDSDGIPDPRDKCPNVAEDLDGFNDQDGCPEEELDRDGDGVIDNFDPCETTTGVRSSTTTATTSSIRRTSARTSRRSSTATRTRTAAPTTRWPC
jgi:hypothetical protein